MVGLLLFGAIVAYSVAQQRKGSATGKSDHVDPLFAELDKSKDKISSPDAKSEPYVLRDTEAEAPVEQAVEPSLNEDADRNTLSKSVSSESNKPIVEADVPQSNTAELNDANKGSAKKAPRLDDADVVTSNDSSVNDSADVNTPPTIESHETSELSEVHKVELAPTPQIDKDSMSVVTELVARINNTEPIEQQGLLALFRKHDFKFHRKVHIYGLNQLTDMWRDIEFELPSAQFVELGVSIQLADREGAMSQKELHDFQQMVLEFTNEYDAPFEFSMNIDDALKQALALDQIGRRYDSMAVLNVVPKAKSGFRMADIESCARDLMMSTDKNGIFMKTQGRKNNITVLYRLACTDGSGQFGITNSSNTTVHDLVVYMNVPATQDPEMVFQEMVKDANSLATWLDGKVVDRQGRAMSQRSYSVLMQQVSDIAFSMQQDGFTPGDDVAKKLF